LGKKITWHYFYSPKTLDKIINPHYYIATLSAARAAERTTMCYIVISEKNEKVLETQDWREACRVAWSVNGRVHTEGRFSNE